MRRARIAATLLVLLALAYAGARVPGSSALLDNFSNFPFHFAVAFLAAGAMLAASGRRLWALAAVVLAIFPAVQVVPWYFAPAAQPDRPTGPFVKLLVSNVHFANDRFDRLERLIAEEDPDVVALVEVSERWLRGLAGVSARYPYRYEAPDDRYVGLALYSRLPLTGTRTVHFGGSTPAIVTTLGTPSGGVALVLAHPTPPLNVSVLQRRNEHVRALAEFVRDSARPAVVAGDLNLTMWNRGYRPLETIAGLRNARAGHGVGPTWPSLGRLGIPLDHILATDGLRLRRFRVLPPIGSDHRPIAAEFALR